MTSLCEALLDLGEVAGEDESGDGEAAAVEFGGGDDAAFLAGVVAVPSGLVVDGHAEQAGQGGFGGGAGEDDAVAARARGSAVAGDVDQREDAFEGQAVRVAVDLGKLDCHGVHGEGGRRGPDAACGFAGAGPCGVLPVICCVLHATSLNTNCRPWKRPAMNNVNGNGLYFGLDAFL
jgi:hypothetical protein